MTDHIDEIIGEVQREFGPVANDDGYALLRAAVEAGIKAGKQTLHVSVDPDSASSAKKKIRSELARKVIAAAEKRPELDPALRLFAILEAMREIAEEGDEVEHYERSMEEFEFDERSREEGE